MGTNTTTSRKRNGADNKTLPGGQATLTPAENHVYLAGAIEYAPDGGKSWRLDIKAFLQNELNLAVFDPCVNEFTILTDEEKHGFRKWKVSNRERFLPVIRRIIDHDLENLLKHTSMVICLWDEHVTKGAGTAGELTAAYHAGIPVYLVTNLPLDGVSSWILGCATEVFSTFDELKIFLKAFHNRGR